MKRIFIAALLSSVVTLPALAALKQGDKAPDFSAKASLAGKKFNFSLKDALKKGPVVVYFYPAAFTGGCNLEAHTFAENKDKFDAAGATIIGVSRDTINTLNEFSSDPQYCAGKFPVAADPDGVIAKSFEVKDLGPIPAGAKDSRGQELTHGLVDRRTYVVGRDAKILATFATEGEDKVSPAQHVDKSLAVVQQLPSQAR